MPQLAPYRPQFFDANGDPLADGKVYFYAAGTTTPQDTYTDSTGGTPNANPVVLDARGEASIWLSTTAGYKVILKTGAGATIWTEDNVEAPQSGIDLAASGGSALVGFLQSGTGASARTVQARLRDVVSVKDFGATGDGSTDDTTAIQAAVVACEAARNAELQFPPGKYKITSTITIKGGIRLVGQGAMGAQDAQGTVFLHCADSTNMLLWNGNHATSSFGTGGGLFNIQCVKENGYSGGDAIKILATDDTHRPGEMTLQNVLVYGNGTGLWTRGLHVDGTACDSSGNRGVRTIHLIKFRVADCTENNQYVYLNQVTHFFTQGLHIDQGDGTGTTGMTVAGNYDEVYLEGEINGNLTFNQTTSAISPTIQFDGNVSATVTVNDTGAKGHITVGSCTGIVNKSSGVRFRSGNLYDVTYGLAGDLTGKTGDDSEYIVLFDSDYGGDPAATTVEYDATTGRLTPYCAGLKNISGQLMLKIPTATSASHTRADIYLKRYNSSDVLQTTQQVIWYPAALAPSAISTYHYPCLPFNFVTNFTFGDYSTISVKVNGAVKDIDISASFGPSMFIARQM